MVRELFRTGPPHRIAQPFQNTPQGRAIDNFRFALLAHLEAAVFRGGQLERDQVARFVLPFLTAQTQQFAACDQRSLSSVKHPVALKMRAKAVRPVVHKRLTQGLQIHMQIFAFNLKAHDCRLYLR